METHEPVTICRRLTVANPKRANLAEIHIRGTKRFGEARTKPLAPSMRAPQHSAFSTFLKVFFRWG
jgi:hypothetical protein